MNVIHSFLWIIHSHVTFSQVADCVPSLRAPSPPRQLHKYLWFSLSSAVWTLIAEIVYIIPAELKTGDMYTKWPRAQVPHKGRSFDSMRSVYEEKQLSNEVWREYDLSVFCLCIKERKKNCTVFMALPQGDLCTGASGDSQQVTASKTHVAGYRAREKRERASW